MALTKVTKGLINPVFDSVTTTSLATGTLSTNSLVSSGNGQTASLGVGVAASGTSGEIRAAGDISSWYSDERLKENIELIPNALQKVLSLSGVTYNSNDVAARYGFTDKSKQVGVLAGDVLKVQPEAVKPAPFDIKQLEDGTEVSASGFDYKTVQYEKLVPLLIEAIKELEQQVRELKGIK